MNEEVYRIYQELDLVTIIKTMRLKWLGHVNRMEDHREPKRFLGVGEGEENQKKRLLDYMKDNLRKTGVKNWRMKKNM
jgi:cobyrinic acid a,c-diamide synthase